MNIGFYLVDNDTPETVSGHQCAQALLASIRRTMRNARVYQFTDLKTKRVKGVDGVRRKPSEPMALLRMRHQAGVPGDWLFLDTDVIIQKNVEHVFDKPFDIAVTTRHWPHLKPAGGFTERMPFNSGVVFSRCPHFWGEVYTRLRNLDDDLQHWMGDQEVICDVIVESRQYDVIELKGYRYNFPPSVEKEDRLPWVMRLEEQAAIVHYKGPERKPMLLDRMRRDKLRCA